MKKIKFEDFEAIMSYDIMKKREQCSEIWFCIDNSPVYYSSWLGKMIDKETNKIMFWFGLTEDSLQAYEYDSFEKLVNADVFNGQSLKELWESVSLLSIDACDPEERLPFYLS